MKQVVSVSLGSSSRDKVSFANILGEEIKVSRIGVDGDKKRFIEKIKELDGNVDAIGLGGIDLYLCIDGKRYTIKDARIFASYAKKTPVVDGSGVKNTIERMTLEYLNDQNIIDFADSKVMLVCSLDRFGMAETLGRLCKPGNVLYGDVMYSLGIHYPIYDFNKIRFIAKTFLPIVCNIPFELLYPTGGKQNEKKIRYQEEYKWADIISGDFLYINKYLPSIESGILENKIIITNTLTSEDVENLKNHNVKLIVSTTPNLGGRNFGTNVLEGIITALLGKSLFDTSEEELKELLTKLNWSPSIVYSRKSDN